MILIVVSSLQSSVEFQLTALSEEVATITKPSSQASSSLCPQDFSCQGISSTGSCICTEET